MSIIAEFIELLIGPSSEEVNKEACADYIMRISDDLLRDVSEAFPTTPVETIGEIWYLAITLLIEELKND